MDFSRQHPTMVFHPLIATDKIIKNRENEVECLHILSEILQPKKYIFTLMHHIIQQFINLLFNNKNANSSVSFAAATA